MSWTKRPQEILYRDLTEKASNESPSLNQQPWSLEVWDVSQDGQLREYVQNTVRRLSGKPQLRIVFAPSDNPRRETKGLMVELFHKFAIPHDFTAERARSTSHSFSRRSDDNDGFSSWFRFSYTSHESPDVEDNAIDGAALPDECTERQTAFFLEASNDTNITLVCFGAGPGVRRRMKELIKSQGWTDVSISPYLLFDVVLEGLHEEVDDTVWKIEEEFAPLERSIIRLGGAECPSSSLRVPLAELYFFERHVTELSRALESVIMIGEGVHSSAGIRIPSTKESIVQSPSSPRNSSSSRRSLVDLQLRECLEYRRTLFRSTQLRLSKLQKQTKAATALVSNLMAQQQSEAVRQGPVSMKLIAASIVVFLPTIAVATIAGSQLLMSEQEDEGDSWDVSATPLFYLLWYISIPLTLAVVFLSLGWLWWRQGNNRKAVQPSSWFRKAVIWRHAKGKKDNNEDSSVPV
ncbi:hypothetical protein V8C37DRAFT_416605 [Trichoderma ceciliae]